MGREVKRVHIDFDWFETAKNLRGHTKTWYGYLLDSIDCELCRGTGKNSKGKRCPDCYGEGKSCPKIEPPKGWNDNENGFQIWENVSEGSPVSPVFLKPEDLAKWMVENDTSVTKGTSYEAWLRMIKEEGSAPSGIMDSEGFGSGMKLYEKPSEKNTEAKE